MTVKEIADEIGVAKSTLCKWIAEDEDLSDALNVGRSEVDIRVENSLYSRALGMTTTEKKTIISAGKDGEQKPARVEITEKYIPPDTTACIYWLKNRRPDLWRDTFTHTINPIDETVKRMDEYFAKRRDS